MKLKEDNTPPKEVKEWTEDEKAVLIKLMSKIVTIEETELAEARKNAAEEDELRLIAKSKVRDPDKMIAIIKAILIKSTLTKSALSAFTKSA